MFWLYIRARAVPPLALALLCASKRLHSIFLLRLFNDGPAMLVAYAASALLVLRRWRAAIVCFSAAVSIKMNVLLMAPSVLVIVLKVRSLHTCPPDWRQGQLHTARLPCLRLSPHCPCCLLAEDNRPCDVHACDSQCGVVRCLD